MVCRYGAENEKAKSDKTDVKGVVKLDAEIRLGNGLWGTMGLEHTGNRGQVEAQRKKALEVARRLWCGCGGR